MTLEVGTRIPDVAGTTADGATWRPSDARGKILVLYFYPKDFTPGCTREACGFRDAFDEITGMHGAEVVGVSRDSAESHVRFRAKHDLPFTLVSDEKGEMTKAFGATLLGGIVPVSKRITYVVDEEGIVRGVFTHTLDATRHVEDVRKLVGELRESR
jgi:peroxiredoxin Q/BCP